MSFCDTILNLWRKIKQCFRGKKYYSLDEYDKYEEAVFSEKTGNEIY
jgi:hypothetical protein